MPPIVATAVALMFAAFGVYSLGVFAVFRGKLLRPWHAALFWTGFLLDTAGTLIMRRLAGGFEWNLHTATGMVALLLMLAHASWATITLVDRDERMRHSFYRISLTVWGIWMILFVTGLIIGLRRGR